MLQAYKQKVTGHLSKIFSLSIKVAHYTLENYLIMKDKKYISQICEKMCNLDKNLYFQKINSVNMKKKFGGYELMI